VIVKVEVIILSDHQVLQIHDYILVAQNNLHQAVIELDDLVEGEVALVHHHGEGLGQDLQVRVDVPLQIVGHYLVLLPLQYHGLEVPPILGELGHRADESRHQNSLSDLPLVEVKSDLLQFLRCTLVYLEHNINFLLLAALSLHQAIMWQKLVPKDLIYLADDLY
jgi:hypothetical protein